MTDQNSTRPPGYPATPNLDKALEVKEKIDAINEFLEFIRNDDLNICEVSLFRFRDGREAGSLTNNETARLIARSFDIDYDAMNREQAAVLKYVQEHQ